MKQLLIHCDADARDARPYRCACDVWDACDAGDGRFVRDGRFARAERGRAEREFRTARASVSRVPRDRSAVDWQLRQNLEVGLIRPNARWRRRDAAEIAWQRKFRWFAIAARTESAPYR